MKKPPQPAPPDTSFDPARRRLLAGIAASTAGAAGLAACGGSGSDAAAAGASSPASGPGATAANLPPPGQSGIDHIVVVMMENRSFDHMLGWVPGADGKQAGLSFKHKANGATVPSFRLSQDANYGFQGCQWADPDHGYDGGRIEFNNGACDGFLQTSGTGANAADHFPVGYYTADDVPFYKGAVAEYTVCDRYFCGILAATLPNRMYMHSGQTDRLDNTLNQSSLETIWDRLAAKGRTGLYYAPDLAITTLWGTKYASITRPYESFLLDARNGTLADVTYVDPAFGGSVGEGPGLSKDDHPHADIRDGQAFLNEVYNALRNGPLWSKTLLIVNYDEWGGFFDHVPPPLASVSDAERKLGNDGRLGFRTPCLLIGPRAKKAHVAKEQYDPNAILNFIGWRFGLDPIGVRAPSSGNIGAALDFANPPRTDAPAFDVPSNPGGASFGQPCTNQIAALQALSAGRALHELTPAQQSFAMHKLEMDALRNLAMRNGFAVGPGWTANSFLA